MRKLAFIFLGLGTLLAIDTVTSATVSQTVPSQDGTPLFLGGARWGEYNDFVSGVLGRKSTTTTLTNSTATTTMFSWQVPANVMGTDRMIEFNGTGILYNNAATGCILGVTVKFGNTIIFEDYTGSIANTTKYPFDLHVFAGNQGSASAQAWGGSMKIGPASFSSVAGNWELSSDEIASFTPMNATSTINTAVDNQFEVQFTCNVADTDIEFQMHYGLLELK